jgi:hypothetical protein
MSSASAAHSGVGSRLKNPLILDAANFRFVSLLTRLVLAASVLLLASTFADAAAAAAADADLLELFMLLVNHLRLSLLRMRGFTALAAEAEEASETLSTDNFISSASTWLFISTQSFKEKRKILLYIDEIDY